MAAPYIDTLESVSIDQEGQHTWCEELDQRRLVRFVYNLIEIRGDKVEHTRSGGHCGEQEGCKSDHLVDSQTVLRTEGK